MTGKKESRPRPIGFAIKFALDKSFSFGHGVGNIKKINLEDHREEDEGWENPDKNGKN